MSLMLVLFIIVVVALLANSMIRLASSSNTQVSFEMINSRAFFAAESGAQAYVTELFPIPGGPGVCGLRTYTFNQPGLANCKAEISCTSTTAAGETLYRINSQGQCNTGAESQATRTIEVIMR